MRGSVSHSQPMKSLLPSRYIFPAVVFVCASALVYAADPTAPAANPLQPLGSAPAAAAPAVPEPALPVSALGPAPAAGAQVGTAPAQPTDKKSPAGKQSAASIDASVTPIPSALGGAWVGTFVCTSPNNASESRKYRISVDTRIPSIEVSEVGSSEAIARPSLFELMSPTTNGRLLPARWDGQKLEQAVSQNSFGRAPVSLGKRLTIALEPDGRHARFTYDVKHVQVGSRNHTDMLKTSGTGILSRSH